MLSEGSQTEKATYSPIYLHILSRAKHWGETRSVAARAWGEGGFDNKNMEKFWGAILFYLDCGGGDQTKYFTNISCGGA